ncbi:Methyl-accepting chemotaxis protein McpA [compost metagenome]
MVANLRAILTDIVTASEKVNAHSEELTESAGEVKVGSAQVALTMQELALGAETQAGAATDLSNSMTAFAAIIEEANNLSKQVSYSSNEVQELANKGSLLMASSIQQMTSIDRIVHDAVLKVRTLNNQSEQISEIVTVVNGIAAQTNLLALNAAIEAARAGEHGRGFAIVANEVRKLSEQVSHSIAGITEILNGISVESSDVVTSLQYGYQEVEKGTEQIKLTGRTLEHIAAAVSDTAIQIHSITDALSRITAKSVDMNQSIENVAAVSEEAAAGTEQSTASIEQTKGAMVGIAHSAEELSQLAENLNALVRQFKV